MRCRFVLVALFLIACTSAAAGQSAADRSITTFFLHAWVPELGQPPLASTAAERKLSEAALLALDGRMRSAAAALDAAGKSASTARERTLLLLFRHQLLLRRYRYIGGALFMNSDTILEGGLAKQTELFQQVVTAGQSLPPAEGQDVFGAAQWSVALATMLDIPAMLRNRGFSNPNDYAESMKYQDQAIEAGRNLIGAAVQTATAAQTVAPRDLTVLRHLLAGNEARARRDSAVSRREFDAAITVATRRGAAELRIDRGDVFFPYGDALGHDGALASLMVTSVFTQSDLGFTVFPEKDREEALRDWAEAETLLGSSPRLLVRRAAARLFTPEGRDGASRLLAEVARGEGIVAWSALAMLAINEGSRPQLLEAAARARAEDNIGAVASYGEAARIEAAFAGMLGNTPRAAVLLETAADVHGENAERMRTEALVQLAIYYNNIGRYDAAIVTAQRARESHRRFLTRVDAFVAQFPPGQAPLNPVFERRITGQIELALGGAYAARSIATASPSAAALAEAALAAAEKAFRESPLPGEDPTLMTANSVMRSITLAVDQARRKRVPCEEMRTLYRDLRKRAEDAALSDAVLLLDMALPDCDPGRLEEHRRSLEGRDLVAPLRAKVQSSPAAIGTRAFMARIETMKAIITLQIQMDILSTAGAWDALARTATALAELTRTNEGLRALFPYAQGQMMFALNGQGKHAEALRIEDDLHKNWWGVMLPQVRAGVLATALGDEAALCAAADPECDPIRGLLAFERVYFEGRRAGILRTGVQPLQRATAERAALEARVAGGNPLTDRETARLGELRGDGSEAILRETEPSRTSIEEVVATLPAKTRLLVFHPGRDRLLVWDVRRGKARLASIVAKPWDVMAAYTAVEYAVTDRVEEAIPAAAAVASRWLEVLDPPLAAGETLVVVPSAMLARMPFDVLSLNGQRLAGAHPIIYTDHLGSIADRRPPAGPEGSALVVGVNGNGLSTAEAEANAIAAILGATPLLGAAVTREAVGERLPSARIIHFGLHAMLTSDNPYDSYLSFGLGGRFRAWELFRLAPSAELITLSACDTGAESNRPFAPGWFGSSPTSLVSFAFAGNARFVLASLWSIKDSVGTRVMQDFYRFLHGGDSPAVALQRTKQALVAEGNPAYYYANYFLAARSVGALSDAAVKEMP